MLWLMAQNKQSLMKVKDVTVRGKTIKGFIEDSSLGEWTKTIGTYDSNERALEVLQGIFAKIEESQGVSVTFTMPER